MIWTWLDELEYRAGVILRRLFGHTYGCCGRITRRCSRCEYCRRAYEVTKGVPYRQ